MWTWGSQRPGSWKRPQRSGWESSQLPLSSHKWPLQRAESLWSVQGISLESAWHLQQGFPAANDSKPHPSRMYSKSACTTITAALYPPARGVLALALSGDPSAKRTPFQFLVGCRPDCSAWRDQVRMVQVFLIISSVLRCFHSKARTRVEYLEESLVRNGIRVMASMDLDQVFPTPRAAIPSPKILQGISFCSKSSTAHGMPWSHSLCLTFLQKAPNLIESVTLVLHSAWLVPFCTTCAHHMSSMTSCLAMPCAPLEGILGLKTLNILEAWYLKGHKFKFILQLFYLNSRTNSSAIIPIVSWYIAFQRCTQHSRTKI